MASASELFHPDAARLIREAIAEAHGNEVFFVGRRGQDRRVSEVEVLARGHESAVPAVMRGVRTGEFVIHNHPSGVLTPSEPDLAIASHGGASGIAFVIVDNQAREAYTVVEPHEEAPRRAVEADEIERLLGPGGEVAKGLAGYEHRPQQIAMARAVADAFNHDRVSLIEAGTGTGKSLAYLLPAILFATRNRERVVVSTNTINLQEQLIGKDLPFLRDQLGLEFKAVLLKGRSNYVCKRKMEFARGQQEALFDDAGRGVLRSLLAWSDKTRDGSRSDLPFVVPENVWDEVASDGDDCMRVRSPFFSSCFFFQSRREAAAADVVVVNHHLLMADLAARAATGDYTGTCVLPPYERVILDEAHNLEDVAASYFGTQVTAMGLKKSLGRLASERDEKKGVLFWLLEKLGGANLAGTGPVEASLGEAMAAHRALTAEVQTGFETIARDTLGVVGLDAPGDEAARLRVKPSVAAHPAFAEGVLPACATLTTGLGAYAALLARALKQARELPIAEDPAVASALSRLAAVRMRLEAAAEALAAFREPDEAHCRWIEVWKTRKGGTAARVASAPLEVAGLLVDHVYARMKTVVATSATLTVGKSFDHFRHRLGVSRVAAERAATARFDSPFDFARQALVLLPTDMPEPQEPQFAEAVREAVHEAVGISRGRAFVLFTSYSLLTRIHRALEPRLRAAGLVPLKQGDAGRDLLLQRFRRETGCVLFAVDSFWEGVDVPGDALSLVVLVRLPFKVPTEPLQEARVEAIEKAGGDPFLEYTVPQAVIKFRQGFGRLIRTREDRGVVMVLDPRVTTKRYGRLFLDSLPPARVVAEPRARVLEEMRRFFASAPAGRASVAEVTGAGTARAKRVPA